VPESSEPDGENGDAEPSSNDLSARLTGRALHAFVISGTFWGAWSRVVGIGSAVFTGYALWLGATEAEIAYFVSIASVTSLAQIVSSPLIGRIRNPKRFVFIAGLFEMLFRLSIVIVPPLLFGESRILVLGLLLGVGLAFGHINSPIYSGWLANIIPEDIRARYIGRKTNANLIAGIVTGFAAGYYLDLFPAEDAYDGFWSLFVVATGIGILGYIRLMPVPYLGDQASERRRGHPLQAFRNPRFTALAVFFLTWTFSHGIAGPFYSVFMLKQLNISYTTVAVFNNVFMISMIVGYKVFGPLVDRYGSKAILNILIPPTLITPILWTFNRPDAYGLIPVAMGLNGMLHAGILTSVSSLLYASIPDDANKTSFFAAWSTAINLAYACSPLVGSYFVTLYEPYQFQVFGYPVGNLQLVFLTSAATVLVPIATLGLVQDSRSKSTRELLSQIGKGNILSFVYGSLVFDRAGETRRARAARWMGRSQSPMALDRLIDALDDASPEVRRQAARGLGEARSREAVSHLLDELKDEESDIRTEAAEALGKIGDPAVIDPLIDALDDPDSRVQISAIRALHDIGGEEADELLFWKFGEEVNRATFPTLADVLARSRDLRMIRPTLERMTRYRSPAIRLQLLNSVTIALGARRRFYRMISLDPIERASRVTALLEQASRRLRRSPSLGETLRTHLVDHLERANHAAEQGNVRRFVEEILSLSDTLVAEMARDEIESIGTESAARVGAIVLAVRTYVSVHFNSDREENQEVFLATCIWCLGDALNDGE